MIVLIKLDRIEVDWRTLKLREKTREVIEIISNTEHEEHIKAIILYGSEARGEAKLFSDIDLAIIPTRQIKTWEEKSCITKNIPINLSASTNIRIAVVLEENLYTGTPMNIGTSIRKEGVLIYENVL